MPRLFRNLLDRRVPQYTALYLGGCWAVIEFVSLLEERYLLSPRLTDFCLLTLALLLPSVVLFAYHHGRPGADELHRTEKVLIPANLVLGVGVLWMVFGGSDLGAMTKTVEVATEEGGTVERVVPKAEYRRRLGIFSPAFAGPDSSAWQAEGVGLAILYDLSQDPFLDLRAGPHFDEAFREAGIQPGEPSPLALKRRIAEEQHLSHFIEGDLVPDSAGGVRMALSLYEADPVRRLAQVVLRGRDTFELTDSATVWLRRELEIPAAHIENTPDLPVEEMLTASSAAYRSYVNGALALRRSDWAAGERVLERAVELDPTFSAAAFDLFITRLYTGDNAGAMHALELATEHLYRVPERFQFSVKANHYIMRNDREKAVAVLEMGTELFPDDAVNHKLLAQLYAQSLRREDAIRKYERVLELDPSQSELLLQIGGLHRDRGQYDQALERYREYAELFPENTAPLMAMGDLHRLIGEHEQARRQYERALMLESGDVDVLLRIARLARDVGDIEVARSHLERASDAARTPAQRHQVEDAFADFYLWQGQADRALEHARAAIRHAQQALPPFLVAAQQLQQLELYTLAGRRAEAEALLTQLAPGMEGPFSGLLGLGRIGIHMGSENPDPAALESGAEDVARLVTGQGWNYLQPRALRARARAAEARDRCERALELLEQALALEPTDATIHTDRARCLRRLGRTEDAVEAARRTLEVRPAHPQALTQLGLAYLELGRRDDARRQLHAALRIWSDADPGYHPARSARERLAELTGPAVG